MIKLKLWLLESMIKLANYALREYSYSQPQEEINEVTAIKNQCIRERDKIIPKERNHD